MKKLQIWVHLSYASALGEIPLKSIRVLTSFIGNMQYWPGKVSALYGIGFSWETNMRLFIYLKILDTSRQQRRQRKEGHLFRQKLIALPPPDLTNQNQLSLDLTTPSNPAPKI